MAGAPVGTVCAYAGQVTRSTQGKNTIWSGTACGANAAAPVGAAAAAPAPVILIEALGWMLCDGRFLGVAQYPELYKVLGAIYGQGTDASGQTTFRIPDYRGLFLRGTDDGAGMDLDDRVAPQGQGSGAGVGSLQCDALQSHTHDYKAVQLTTPANQGQAAAASSTEVPTSGPQGCRVSSRETRPKNIAVNYIIKYRD